MNNHQEYVLKQYLLPLLTIIVLMHSACTPKVKIGAEPSATRHEQALFSQAEMHLESKDYAKALAAYQAFLKDYPSSPKAPEALLKTGMIYESLNQFQQSQNSYEQLIDSYPRNPLLMAAHEGKLRIRLKQGLYQEVIEQAPEIIRKFPLESDTSRLYAIWGDAFLAAGLSFDAFEAYRIGLTKAKPEMQAGLVDRLTQAINQLNNNELKILVQGQQTPLIQGYLLFQLASNSIDQGDYEQARASLSTLTEHYANHEKSPQAKGLLEQLDQLAEVKRDTIGCLLPLTGSYSYFGNRALRGLELALSELGQQDGASAFKVIIRDTASSPQLAAQAARDLINQNVIGIIGPIVTADAAAQIAQEYHTPIITITQKEGIPDIGDYVFRNFHTPQMQIKTLMSFIKNTLKIDTFAILYPNETYGKKFMNLFWDEVIASGGRIVGLQSYQPSQTDFAEEIKKLVGLYYETPEDLLELDPRFQMGKNDENELTAGASLAAEQNQTLEDSQQEEELEPIVDFDAIFIPDAPTKAGLIIPQLFFHDVSDVYLLGTNLWHSDKMIDMAKDYAQGAIMVDVFFADSKKAIVKNFVALYENTYVDKPGFIEAIIYDTAVMLFNVLQQENIQYRSSLRDALKRVKGYSGVTGLTSFEENGDVRKKLSIIKIKGDQFVELPTPNYF
jgi:ABC-type branched-subunit amino acid transport system substrate-binding protein/Tfp pilus assembly protein PilF